MAEHEPGEQYRLQMSFGYDFGCWQFSSEEKKRNKCRLGRRNHQFYTETQKILDKIKGILRGKDIIKSLAMRTP